MKIVSISLSVKAGLPKKPVYEAYLVSNQGIKGDIHAGPWHRQLSFLSAESIEALRRQGFNVDFGSFAENIATQGIDWDEIVIGTRLRLGSSAVVEITQKGKACHGKCAVYYLTGDCIMPKEGTFARVLRGGMIYPGDFIRIY